MRGFAAAHESDLSGQFIATSATPKASLVRESYPKWPELWLRIYSKLPRSFVFPEICSSHSETIFAVLVGEFIVFHCVCFKGVCFLWRSTTLTQDPFWLHLCVSSQSWNNQGGISVLQFRTWNGCPREKKTQFPYVFIFFVWGKSSFPHSTSCRMVASTIGSTYGVCIYIYIYQHLP